MSDEEDRRLIQRVTRERAFRAAALALACAASCGCQAGYVLRQGFHQLARRPAEVSIASPRLAESAGAVAAAKLGWVPSILEFCRSELGLTPGDSYTTYVDTAGEPVSHAVTASHPLALIPFEWRFPFVGRVPYKGYFEEADARAEAERLRTLGLETLILPVEAFSTLGWFRDPVVSSMLEGNVADLADVIIHETTHRTVYFPGAASLNESLATYVARQGTIRFLSGHADLRELLPPYLAERKASAAREELFLRLKRDLEALYRSPPGGEAREERKAEVFRTASAAYRLLRGGSEKASIPASNAVVLSVARYHEHESLLEELERKLGGNLARLVAYLKSLPALEDPVEALKRAIQEAPFKKSP